MQKWQAHASQFVPLTLTFTFTLALTLIFIPSTLAQPEQLESEEEPEKCTLLPDQPCTPEFSVNFDGQELTCDKKVNPDLASSEPEMKLGVVRDEEEPNEVQSQLDSEDQEKMLVVMVDPDAPSQDSCPQTYFLHWIAQADLKDGVVDSKKDFVGYKGPSPPLDSGLHRYQLLLYSLDDKEVNSSKLKVLQRTGFDLQNFVDSEGLDAPVASFQFRAEN